VVQLERGELNQSAVLTMAHFASLTDSHAAVSAQIALMAARSVCAHLDDVECCPVLPHPGPSALTLMGSDHLLHALIRHAPSSKKKQMSVSEILRC